MNWWKKMMKRELMPSTARPATPSPITAPPPKETFRALEREVFAAWVVRTFALVAIFMPRNPARAEKKQPTTKPATIRMLEWAATFGTCERMPRPAPATTTYTPRILYSALRKAMAPSEMWDAIPDILASPESCLVTQPARTVLYTRATSPRMGMR